MDGMPSRFQFPIYINSLDMNSTLIQALYMLTTAISTLGMNKTEIGRMNCGEMDLNQTTIQKMNVETLYVELLPKFWLSASIIMLCLCMGIWLTILIMKMVLIVRQIRKNPEQRLLSTD